MGQIESALPELKVSKPEAKKDQDGSDRSDSSGESTDSSEEDVSPKTKKVKVKVDNSWKQKELKALGIKLTFTNKDDALTVNECNIKKWSVDERNKRMEEIVSGKDEFIASDIFEVTGPKFTLKEYVHVFVTLGKDISKRHKVKVKMMIHGKWRKEEAVFKRGKAEFKTKEVEHFVIVGDIITKKVKVPPEGAKVKVDENSKMEVDIPPGAVDTDQDMDFQIIPPDATAKEKYLGGDKPLCKTLVGVTECLYGKSPSALTFKKPVTVKLPFEDRPEDKEDITLALFRMVGNEIRMMDRNTNFGISDDGVCNLQVSAFSGYFAGYVRTDYMNDTKTIESETRLLFGKNYIATILIFREKEKMPTGFPKLWIEIVDKVSVERTVKKRVDVEGMIELPNSRSPDIKVFDGYRLRIDFVGNLKGLREIPKSHYLITYLDVADDNHKVFTVEKKGEVVTNIGIINFYSDKGNKECVHSVQIDTVVGFDKVYRSDHRQEARPRHSVSEDAVSRQTSATDYASHTNIDNESLSGVSGQNQPVPLERQKSVTSIGSATTLLSQTPLCPALNEASLFNMAEMIKGDDDGLKLSARLGMSDDFDSISQGSLSQRAAVFKLLKEYVKKQTTPETAVEQLYKALQAAKLKKVADAFMKAVKKHREM